MQALRSCEKPAEGSPTNIKVSQLPGPKYRRRDTWAPECSESENAAPYLLARPPSLRRVPFRVSLETRDVLDRYLSIRTFPARSRDLCLENPCIGRRRYP